MPSRSSLPVPDAGKHERDQSGSWLAPFAAGPRTRDVPATAPRKQATWALYDAALDLMTDGPEAGRGRSVRS